MDTKSLLLVDDTASLRDIMSTKVVTLAAESTLKAASELLARYLFRALPIVDPNGRILGVPPYRDVAALRHRYVERDTRP